MKQRSVTRSKWSLMWMVVVAVSLAFGLPAAYGQAKKVDLNTATQKELEDVKGVGPATAKKIIANRPYKNVDELKKAGLSDKQIKSIGPSVTVGAAPAAPAAKPAAAAPAAAAPAKAEKAAPAKSAPGGKVDLNTATQKELEDVKGVGPATAKKIIAGRPYKSVDELKKAGLSDKQIKSIGPSVTVGAAPAAVPAATPAAKPAPAAAAPAKSAKAEKAAPAKLAPGEKVNINTAPKEKLDALPGIGPVKAQAIIDGRPFAKPEDIMKVKGIKQGEYNKIKDIITVR
jgi:competence protein ComEA